MYIEPEVQEALAEQNPEQALRSLVQLWHEEGVSKARACMEPWGLLSERSLSTQKQQAVCAVVNALRGKCAPKDRLLPDQPDVF